MEITKQNQETSGFTLIEMAIVMIIGGILLSFMGSALLIYVEKSRVRDTEVRLDAVKEALSQYLNVNRRYPCPARFDVAPGENTGSDPSFGREVNTDCGVGVIAGTERAPSAVPTVRIGAVPVRSLNLPDEMAFDGWGRRFTYAVTEDLASLGGPSGTLYTHDGGTISVQDSTRNNFITDAHFALVSHGRSGEGGYTFSGNQTSPCPDATTLDGENCNNDDTFMITLVNSEADPANFYDDYVAYQGQTQPTRLIPTGAIMAFNLPGCPPGWQALPNNQQGKFIVSADDDRVPLRTHSIEPSSAVPLANGLDVSAGTQASQDHSALIPAYVAFLFCEKD